MEPSRNVYGCILGLVDKGLKPPDLSKFKKKIVDSLKNK